uniref:Putative cytochrome c oxidase assembly factor 6 n=1 Tax=Tabanus bromius TaxID=304241 RepID=A0A0K8TPN8_TABBR
MTFPTKEERTKCWDARDQYWACLEKNDPTHSSTSGEDVPAACVKLRKLFTASCPAQWVKHFDRKRTYDQFKQRMQKGFDPVESEK